MGYTLQYGQVYPYLGYLAEGAALSFGLAAIGFLAGWLIGLVCAAITVYGRGPLRWLVRAYVIFFLNTPILVQIFFLFFALPDYGIFLTSFQAVTLGLALNAGAYLTEIQRAGFASMRREEMELRRRAAHHQGTLPATIQPIHPGNDDDLHRRDLRDRGTDGPRLQH
jgi:polar amino acid transport system permease protein